VRDQPLAIYGNGKRGVGLALEMLTWSRDLALCTDGPADLRAGDRDRLAQHGIAVREERIARMEGEHGVLERIIFANGEALARRALCFNTGRHQRSDLLAKLGVLSLHVDETRPGQYEITDVHGLYVAGDAAHQLQLAIVAAVEGAEEAVAINTALLKEELGRGQEGSRRFKPRLGACGHQARRHGLRATHPGYTKSG
jgi:thioredoxin reductase